MTAAKTCVANYLWNINIFLSCILPPLKKKLCEFGFFFFFYDDDNGHCVIPVFSLSSLK